MKCFFCFSLSLTISIAFSKSMFDKLLVVSYDGFRYDYLDKSLTPYLYSLKERSSYAKYLLNVFPTQTFVNHFSIATGLYSGVHGVIGNNVYDKKTGKLIKYGYDLFHYNNDVTPIWTLNQKAHNGRHSGVMMWPGSQFAYGGVSPTFVNTFDLNVPWEKRVSTVMSWFLHAKTPANLVMMYFEEPDDEEHASGPAPDSPQTRERLKKVDKITEHIFKSLKDHSLTDVNVVLLSDHGMEGVTLNRIIDLTKFVGDKADMYGTSPVLQVYPKSGQNVDDVFKKLNDAAAKNKHFKVYLKAKIPEHFYMKDCERTPPILAVAEPTYAFQDYYQAIEWQINNKGEMSLLPLINDLWLDDFRRPRLSDLYDQHFGLGLLNNETLTPASNYLLNPLRTGYLRPWRNLAVGESGISSIQSDKNEFRVNLDVQQFKPEELKVKIADGFIIVEGKHEERSDQHGFISRQFVRKYKIPEDVEETSIASSLSSDGVLTLKAPKKGAPAIEGREIPITTTNQPAVLPKPEKQETSP